jgi:EmrB/QacA subfamily drug resistance transporter
MLGLMKKVDPRWLALITLCLGVLMIVLDTTVVNVALPSIRDDLGFDASSLAWVVNAYMLTFGGFLLLGGRLGDLFGHRKLFLMGLTVFTVASLGCGLAQTQWFLITARALQGLGGAVVSAVALSLVMNLFTEEKERAKAMGVYSFVASAGGSVGVLVGGILTNSFDWHWNFLVNLPIGILVFALCMMLVPAGHGMKVEGRLDFAGAVTVTAAMLLAVYGVVNGNQAGWNSLQTLGTLASAAVLFVIFIGIEANVRSPLMPLRLFGMRNIATASVVGMLWSGAMFAQFFISALYLQMVLHYDPLQIGLSFLPANLIMSLFSLGLSARVVMHFGIKKSLTAGLSLCALALLLFVRAPVEGSYVTYVLPSMVLLGFGAGISFNPLLLAAMSEVKEHESGLASGVVNTAFMMGGSLGLAVLASLAAFRTQSMTAAGADATLALNSGYHAAFLTGAIFAAVAATLGATLLRVKKT